MISRRLKVLELIRIGNGDAMAGESTTTTIRHREEFDETDSEVIIASQILSGLFVSGGMYIVRKHADFPRTEELIKKPPAVGDNF